MPPTTRSLFVSSRSMFPGIARSGLYATRTSLASPAACGNDRSARAPVSQPQSRSVVPTGDVDSRITRLPRRSSGARLSAAARTKRRSGSWSAPCGVGTAMMNASAGCGVAAIRSVPAATTVRTNSFTSSSAVAAAPEPTASRRSASTSTPNTSTPPAAMLAAVGSPT